MTRSNKKINCHWFPTATDLPSICSTAYHGNARTLILFNALLYFIANISVNCYRNIKFNFLSISHKIRWRWIKRSCENFYSQSSSFKKVKYFEHDVVLWLISMPHKFHKFYVTTLCTEISSKTQNIIFSSESSTCYFPPTIIHLCTLKSCVHIHKFKGKWNQVHSFGWNSTLIKCVSGFVVCWIRVCTCKVRQLQKSIDESFSPLSLSLTLHKFVQSLQV